ncbi:MAG: TIR domain-containing protein [Phycisphaerae bacterium]|nr:TIR domain-containing protein [Phycisphaerae bacterium]MDD5381396.1 TIR domain-containing protein [Phycisphaerae bacterium]
MKNVFVSYANEDREKVQKYVSRLENEPDIEVFWDRKIGKYGDDFLEVLAAQTTKADVLIVFVSQAGLKSRFVRREVLRADEREIRIIPVFLEAIPKSSASGLEIILVTQEKILEYLLGFEDSYKELVERIRRELYDTPSAKDCPIIAVMGRQGGVGKSTFITATADLIAMTGTNVLIIDMDTNTAGIAGYLTPRANRRPRVWTVLDATYAKTGGNIASNRDLGMWEVTPPFLHEKRFGQIFLIPGRHASDNRPGFEAVAGLKDRNLAAMEILEETMQRSAPAPIGAILIDSPADDTPLVSAGFALASYGYVICRPTIELARDLSRLDNIHQQRYPDNNVPSMHLIVNMATGKTKQLWDGMNASFVREDPTVRENVDKGTLDFNLVGLTSLYEDVLAVHHKHFLSTDQKLLPDELDVWVRPYIKVLVERNLSRKLMRNWWFRSKCLAGFMLLVLGVVMIGGFGYLGYHNINKGQPSYKLAVIQVDSRDTAEMAKQRIVKGEGFSKVAEELSTDLKTAAVGGVIDKPIAPLSPVPGIGVIEGLQSVLEKTLPGATCDQVFQVRGKFYLVRLVEKLASQTENAMRYQLARFVGALGLILGFILAGLSPFLYVKWRRRKALLVEISQRGADKRYLDELFRKSKETGALKWLKEIFKEAIEAEKQRLSG